MLGSNFISVVASPIDKNCWQFAYLIFISKIKLDQHVLFLGLPQPFYQGWDGDKSFHLLFIKGKNH